MNSLADKEIDAISQEIIQEIEKSSSRELADSDEIAKIPHLTDARQAKRLLQHIENASTRSERDVGKKAVIKAFLLSTWLQRLYLAIRSLIMGILRATLTFGFTLVFGPINITLGIALEISSFIFSLVVSRLFDVPTAKATKKVVAFLGKNRTYRTFALDRF